MVLVYIRRFSCKIGREGKTFWTVSYDIEVDGRKSIRKCRFESGFPFEVGVMQLWTLRQEIENELVSA